MMTFGDKAAFDFYVSKLDDPKAATLQTVLQSAVKGTLDYSVTIIDPPMLK